MILEVLKSIFSLSKASDVAIDIVRKVTDTDGMTDKEKSEFVLEYMKATANQSVARRVIAIGLFSVYVMFLLSWLACFFLLPGESADHIQGFITEILSTPVNLVLSYYFLVNYIKGIGK